MGVHQLRMMFQWQIPSTNSEAPLVAGQLSKVVLLCPLSLIASNSTVKQPRS